MSAGAGSPAPPPPPRALSRPARITLALLLAAVLGAIGWAAERLLTPSDDGDRPEVYSIDGTQPGDLTPGLDLVDNVRHYGLPADLEYHFATNRLGFRGPEPDGDGPVVLLLGDSFAFGMGVGEGETFADHLRESLRRHWPGAVVHNAAVPGYTITDQVEQWRQKLSVLQPDWVLVCHTASDLKEMARPTSFRRLSRWDDEDAARPDPEVAAVVARHGGEKSAAAREAYVFSQDALLQRLGAGAPVALARLRDQYGDAVLTLAEEVRAVGGRLAVVLWVDGYGMADLTVEPLRARLEEAGIPVLAGMRALHSSGPDLRSLFLPDGHFSARGNAILARDTAAWLLRSNGAQR